MKRALPVIVFLSLLANGVLVQPLEASAAKDNVYRKAGASYVTKTNSMASGKGTEWKDVYGFYSINNNNKGIDYKVDKKVISNVITALGVQRGKDVYVNELPERVMQDLSIEKAYLIENGYVSRRAALCYGKEGISAVQRNTNDDGNKADDGRDLMCKTELYTSLYRILKGTLESRPVIWRTGAFRNINGGQEQVYSQKNYKTSDGESVHAIFSADYNVYVDADVPELYLAELLNKGLLAKEELSTTKSNFLAEYSRMQASDYKAAWAATAGPILLDGNASMRNYLGDSVTLHSADGNTLWNAGIKYPTNVGSGSILMDRKQPDYFRQENLTTMDALKIIEHLVRNFEKDMTKTEAATVAYKYGNRFLSTLDSDSKDTITFLTAKGILNFEDPSEYVDLYQDFTYSAAYKLLYRVANENARYDFSKIQLTDNDVYWQERGFAEDEIAIVDGDDLPYMKILEDGETFRSYDDKVKRSVTVAPVIETEETETEPIETEETETEEDTSECLLYVQCLDADSNEPIAGSRVEATDWNGNLVEEGVSDEQGVILFHLGEGTYYFRQTSVPDGYIVNDYHNSVTFSSPSGIKRFAIRNGRNTVGKISVQVLEEDSDAPVPGTSIEIYDNKGELSKTFSYKDELEELWLPFGIYTVRVSSVPEGYGEILPTVTKTVKISEYNREASVVFTLRLKSTIEEPGETDGLAGLLGFLMPEQTVYAATKSSYTVKILLEDKDGYSYTYGSTELSAKTKKSDNDDLAADVAVKDYRNSRMLQVTFRIDAKSRDAALSIIESKLRVNGVQKQSSVIGVTEVENSDGVKTTMISADDIKRGIPHIKVINNSTLMNVETGATAMLLPKQGYALVGNKIIRSDNLVVVTDNNTVYYNLEVICSILHNAQIRKINGATSLVGQTIRKEALYDVYSSDGTKLESNYAAIFDSVVYKEVNENGTVTTKPFMYNLDSMSRGISCLTRTFQKRVNTKGNTNADSDVTVIVKWDFIVPDTSSPEAQKIKRVTSSGWLTFQDAADIINTEPEDATLKEWWNYNLDMSNALANFMYGTKSEQYVTCGYLVPSVTVLSSAGGSRGKAAGVMADNHGVFCAAGSLSDSQLNKLFADLSLPQSYQKKYLGGSKNNWWESYYNASRYQNSFVKSLISRAGFRSLAGKEINWGADPNALTVDGHVYGNAEYIVLNNGTVYQNMETEPRFTVNKNAKRLTIKNYAEGSTELTVAKGTRFVVNSGGVDTTFEYCSTETLGDATYHKLKMITTSDKDLGTFSCYLVTKDGATAEQVKKAAEDPGNYHSQLGQDLFEYEKQLYQLLGMQGIPVSNLDYSKRFSADSISEESKKSVVNPICVDFYNDGTRGVRMVTSGQGASSKVDVGGFAKEQNGSYAVREPLIAGAFLYVPTNEYYFAKDSNGTLKLNNGADIGVLNSRVYYCGLNNALRDSILAKSVDTVPVNKIEVGAKVYIGGMLFTKQKDGSLLAGPVTPNGDIIIGIMSAIDKNYESAITNRLLQIFGTQCVVVGTKNIALQSLITSAVVGGRNGTKTSNILFKENGEYRYTTGPKESTAYKTGSTPNVTGCCMSIKVSDSLLCRPIDTEHSVYQMLYCSDGYVMGLGSLPFYPEYLGDENSVELNAFWQKTSYEIHQYVNSMKDKFLEEYQKAWDGDFLSMCKMLVAILLLYLMMVSWICLFFLKSGIGHHFFEALAMPHGYGSRGFDLFAILSLGLFHYDDMPSVSRVMIMNFMFYCIMFLILDVL